MRPETSIAMWSFLWGAIVTVMLLATIRQAWDLAIMLALLQWSPAIWLGQAWDRAQSW